MQRMGIDQTNMMIGHARGLKQHGGSVSGQYTGSNSTLNSALQVRLGDRSSQIQTINPSPINGRMPRPNGQGRGTYEVRVTSTRPAANYRLTLTQTAVTLPKFTRFSLHDASGDNSLQTVFQGGAVRFRFGISNRAQVASIRLEAIKGGRTIALGRWSGTPGGNQLINLANTTQLTGGTYKVRIVAQTRNGRKVVSNLQTIQVLGWSQVKGTAYSNTLTYTATSNTGRVILGRGGTDILNLGIERSLIRSINGMSLNQFITQNNPTTSQAVFRGTAFDYVTLTDGREIYFQGIETLQFSDGTKLTLQVQPDDPFYSAQWNLRASDVESAWRFTKGSSNVLLVSLDTGIPLNPDSGGGIFDLFPSRLLTELNDHDASAGSSHGHNAIGVMAAIANNGQGVAGINWNSQVYVANIYSGGITLQQGIQDALAYARATNKRVVFQGGIQGEYWLESGGTQAQLEQILANNRDIALFAIAAGNGNVDMDDTTSNPWNSAGVARLAAIHSNVIAVGAATWTNTTIVNGLVNATAIDRAGYSNYGQKLTLMAPTDSPVVSSLGELETFSGTSCANPNMAAIASLVWSVNANLNGAQVRQILIDTAMDLGAPGRDTSFGNGLVNADAAVRRAWALARNPSVANLHSGSNLLV